MRRQRVDAVLVVRPSLAHGNNRHTFTRVFIIDIIYYILLLLYSHVRFYYYYSPGRPSGIIFPPSPLGGGQLPSRKSLRATVVNTYIYVYVVYRLINKRTK